MQSSLVATVVLIVLRRVQESIHERIKEEIDQAILQVARQPQPADGNVPVNRSKRLKTQGDESRQATAILRNTLSHADEPVSIPTQKRGHADPVSG